MRKINLFGLFFLITMFSYGENVTANFSYDTTPTYIDNKYFLQGINQTSGIISYITRFESSGHGDYRYSYVVYNYKENFIVSIQNKMWIAQQYYDEIAIEDWSDKKYSFDTYKRIIEETMQQSYDKYELIDFNLKPCVIDSCRVFIVNRERESRWTENINYELRFSCNNVEYKFVDNQEKCDIVKGIIEVNGYEGSDYLLIIQKISRDYFEDDDYYDYVIRGVKK